MHIHIPTDIGTQPHTEQNVAIAMVGNKTIYLLFLLYILFHCKICKAQYILNAFY